MLDLLRQIDFGVIRSLNNLVWGSDFLEFFILLFARYGIAIFILLALRVVIMKDFKSISTAALTISIAGLVNSLIYLVWSRPRPYVAHAAEIHQLGLLVQPESFPSNHAFITFGVATAIYITGHQRAGVLLYLLAFLITFSRVAAGVHYPSDIVGGAILGIVVAPLAKQTYLLIQKLQTHRTH